MAWNGIKQFTQPWTLNIFSRFPLMFEESWRLRLLQAKRTARSYRVKTSIFHNSQPADTGWRWRDVLPASCAFAVPCRFPWAVGLTLLASHKHDSVRKKKLSWQLFAIGIQQTCHALLFLDEVLAEKLEAKLDLTGRTPCVRFVSFQWHTAARACCNRRPWLRAL